MIENLILDISQQKKYTNLDSELMDRSFEGLDKLLTSQFIEINSKLKLPRTFASVLVLLGLLGTVYGLLVSFGGLATFTDLQNSPTLNSLDDINTVLQVNQERISGFVTGLGDILGGVQTSLLSTFAGVLGTVILTFSISFYSKQLDKFWTSYIKFISRYYVLIGDNGIVNFQLTYRGNQSVTRFVALEKLQNSTKQLSQEIENLSLIYRRFIEELKEYEKLIEKNISNIIPRNNEEKNLTKTLLEYQKEFLENFEDRFINSLNSTQKGLYQLIAEFSDTNSRNTEVLIKTISDVSNQSRKSINSTFSEFTDDLKINNRILIQEFSDIFMKNQNLINISIETLLANSGFRNISRENLIRFNDSLEKLNLNINRFENSLLFPSLYIDKGENESSSAKPHYNGILYTQSSDLVQEINSSLKENNYINLFHYRSDGQYDSTNQDFLILDVTDGDFQKLESIKNQEELENLLLISDGTRVKNPPNWTKSYFLFQYDLKEIHKLIKFLHTWAKVFVR